MNSWLLVAAGGAIGSTARFALSAWIVQSAGVSRFPLGTFFVNIVGCLAIGILGALAVKHQLLPAGVQAFLMVGVLGGFTTFSAFGLETFHMILDRQFLLAMAYVCASVIVGVAAVATGFALVPGAA